MLILLKTLLTINKTLTRQFAQEVMIMDSNPVNISKGQRSSTADITYTGKHSRVKCYSQLGVPGSAWIASYKPYNNYMPYQSFENSLVGCRGGGKKQRAKNN